MLFSEFDFGNFKTICLFADNLWQECKCDLSLISEVICTIHNYVTSCEMILMSDWLQLMIKSSLKSVLCRWVWLHEWVNDLQGALCLGQDVVGGLLIDHQSSQHFLDCPHLLTSSQHTAFNGVLWYSGCLVTCPKYLNFHEVMLLCLAILYTCSLVYSFVHVMMHSGFLMHLFSKARMQFASSFFMLSRWK